MTTADFDPLVAELQAFVETANLQRFLALLAPDADEAEARSFASRALQETVTRAVVLARFVLPAEDFPDGSRYHLTVEAFTESGNRARLQTWQLDVVPATPQDGAAGRWRIAGHQGADTIDGLHHLELNPARQFDAAGFALSAEDMQLRVSRGTAFVSEIDSGITGLLLIGDGMLTFSPAPEAERRQIEIFCGARDAGGALHARLRPHQPPGAGRAADRRAQAGAGGRGRVRGGAGAVRRAGAPDLRRGFQRVQRPDRGGWRRGPAIWSPRSARRSTAT